MANHKFTPTSFMDRVTARQSTLGLTDHEVEVRMGVPSGVRFSSIKKEIRPLSLDDVPRLAIALELDPGDLLRHALRERAPDFLQMLDQYMHPGALTAREAQVLAQFRNMVKDDDEGQMVYEVTTHRAMIIDSVRRVPLAGSVAPIAQPPKM